MRFVSDFVASNITFFFKLSKVRKIYVSLYFFDYLIKINLKSKYFFVFLYNCVFMFIKIYSRKSIVEVTILIWWFLLLFGHLALCDLVNWVLQKWCNGFQWSYGNTLQWLDKIAGFVKTKISYSGKWLRPTPRDREKVLTLSVYKEI